MSTWSNEPTATLRVRKANSSESVNFVGVNSANNAGSPEDFLNAANHLLDFAGLSAVKTGMKRTVTQEVIE